MRSGKSAQRLSLNHPYKKSPCPSLYPAYYHLGRAPLLQQRFDEALAAFEQMRQMAPKANSADLGVSQAYLEEAEYDKALRALTASFKPAGVTYYWLLRRQGRPHEGARYHAESV